MTQFTITLNFQTANAATYLAGAQKIYPQDNGETTANYINRVTIQLWKTIIKNGIDQINAEASAIQDPNIS
jgi:hypothetical protein